MKNALRFLVLISWVLLAVIAIPTAPDALRRVVCNAECQAQYLTITNTFRELTATSVRAVQAGKDPRLELEKVQVPLDALKEDKIGILAITESGEIVMTSQFGTVTMLAKLQIAKGTIQWTCRYIEKYTAEPPKPRACSATYPEKGN